VACGGVGLLAPDTCLSGYPLGALSFHALRVFSFAIMPPFSLSLSLSLSLFDFLFFFVSFFTLPHPLLYLAPFA